MVVTEADWLLLPVLQAGYSEQPGSAPASGVKDLLMVEPRSKGCVGWESHSSGTGGGACGVVGCLWVLGVFGEATQ